jgi:acyl carrier protein
MAELTPTLTEEIVIDAVNEVLATKRAQFEPATAQTSLDDIGLDSLEIAELFATIEDRSGLELDPDSARSVTTVGDLTQLQVVEDH